jgi:hypothetical protein
LTYPGQVKPLEQHFKSIDEAIAQLGNPDRIWLRGHTESHRLVPWLFRLPGGIEREKQIANRFLSQLDHGWKASFQDFEKIIEMHNNYIPTRLIEWSNSLYVALFCAIARELQAPTIFVLDPLGLNRLSGIEAIPRINSLHQVGPHFSGWPTKTTLPDAPIAIRSSLGQPRHSTSLYTLHGNDRRPLEEQCAGCVRKVVLTDKERSIATEYILSGE